MTNLRFKVAIVMNLASTIASLEKLVMKADPIEK